MIYDLRFMIGDSFRNLRRILRLIVPALILLSTLNSQFSTAHAASTINAANRQAYAANFGWLDWRGDSTSGAVIGDYVCSGFIYAANVGWINLGSGSPTNGVRYLNLSANDCGVNQDGLGNLRGYAYGANIGWINFENTGAPRVDLLTGNLAGYAYSANFGWISLSNASAYVQTDSLYPGPLAPNGLPIPWLLTYFGTTNVNPNADPTDKGMTIGQDYLAGPTRMMPTACCVSPPAASRRLAPASVSPGTAFRRDYITFGRISTSARPTGRTVGWD